jgi:ABC-type sugar transport system ATPase subunit
MKTIVEMTAIRKEFPGVVALDNIHFDLCEGEIHGLVGENGAGKSTMINILAGVFRQTQGELKLFGKKTHLNNPSEGLSNGIGVVYQDTVLVPFFTAEENIWLGCEPTTVSVLRSKEIKVLTRKLCEKFEIHIPLDIPVGRLSVAEQKMVEILRALNMNSKILVLDEPTAAITRKDTDNLFGILKNLCQKDIGIIFVSHHLDEVFSICDRITVLRNGTHVGTFISKELSTKELIKLMTDRDLVDQYPKKTLKAGEKEILSVKSLSTHHLGLQDISFNVRENEIVGFFGMVGCSRRTELMKSIFGAYRIDNGEVWLSGKRIRTNSPSAAMKAGIYLCPEDRRKEGVVQDMSVLDNLTSPFLGTLARLGIVSRRKATEKADKVSRELKIKMASLQSVVSHLSGGNQQKVVLGKWLLGPESKVFIFDEPTQGIDIGAKVEFYKLMQEIAKKGCGVIFVSSDIRELIGITDRIYVMRFGRIVAEYAREEFDQHKILECALSGSTVSESEADE